jgi:hypothetical protein
MVRMRGLACIGVLGVVACTASNPAYQGQDAGAGNDSGSASETAGGTTPGDSNSSGGEEVCELHPERPLDILLHENGVPMRPTCDTLEPLWLGQGNNYYPPMQDPLVIRHSKCPEPAVCPCTGDSELTIEMGPDVRFGEGLALPGCGNVALWPMVDADGECQWGGVVLFHETQAMPDYIASNTLDVPPFALTLDLVEDGTCDTPECPGDPPGRYAIRVYEDEVDAEQPAIPVDVPLGLGEVFMFDNRMASVTRECELAVAWTAQRVW